MTSCFLYHVYFKLNVLNLIGSHWQPDWFGTHLTFFLLQIESVPLNHRAVSSVGICCSKSHHLCFEYTMRQLKIPGSAFLLTRYWFNNYTDTDWKSWPGCNWAIKLCYFKLSARQINFRPNIYKQDRVLRKHTSAFSKQSNAFLNMVDI